ncbi:hypothetical protein [Streptomyces atriruber]|uniref:hypothetical protein n=1 Tax=Streptomyces atriruber TaxID=545121 RepID=UPI0006E2FDB0|nr:hypothetical protein [Streptomyces atriruber]
MTINVDLLLEIREQITSHPETHDQEQWGKRTGCGTTHCIAGWAAVLTGAALAWTDAADLDDINGDEVVTYADDHENPSVYAQRVIGLPPGEVIGLFYELDNAEALEALDRLIEKGKNAA